MVSVAFREPWYWRSAEIVSLLFWAGIIGYLGGRRMSRMGIKMYRQEEK